MGWPPRVLVAYLAREARVVEVEAPLTEESNGRAAGFTNLQVRAVIGP